MPQSLWIVVLATLSVACGSPGRLEVSTAAHDYGPVVVGASAVQTIKLRNAGGRVMTVTSAKATDAAFAAELDQPLEIAPGAVANLAVVFAPQSYSRFEAELQFVIEDGAGAAVRLSGVGIPADCDGPKLLDYGVVAVGDSKRLHVGIANVTDHPQEVTVGDPFSAEGSHSAFVFASDSLRGTSVIAPGTSGTVAFEFRPGEVGSYSAAFKLRPSVHCEEQTVALTGEAMTHTLYWSPISVDCGYVPPGVSVDRPVTFLNQSAEHVQLTQLKMLNTTEFGIKGEQSALTVPPATRAADGSRVLGEATLTVVCRPSALGPRQTSLTFNTGLTQQPTGSILAKVHGGGPDIDVAPLSTVDFGKVAYFPNGSSLKERVLTITNRGTAPAIADAEANLKLGVPQSGGGFGLPYADITPLDPGTDITEFSATLPASYDPNAGVEATPGKDSVPLLVTFKPGSAGLKRARLRIFSNDVDEPVIELTLQAQALVLPPCNYTVTPAVLDFGLVGAPEERELTVRVRNNGTNVTETCLVEVQAHGHYVDAPFSIVSGATKEWELGPGKTAEITLRFSPQPPVPLHAANVRDDLRLFVSSDTSPTADVPLQGMTGTSCLAVAPNGFDFGTVKTGCSSATRTFNLYNVCPQAVTVTDVALRCSDPATCGDFKLQKPSLSSSGTAVNAGAGPLSAKVTYEPAAARLGRAELVVTADQGSGTVQFVAPLSGQSTTQGIHTQVIPLPSSPKADVLLVIDDSSCNLAPQHALGSGFGAFTQYANATNVDYRIAVTTANPTNGGRFISGSLHPEKILTPTTPDVADKFREKVLVGSANAIEWEADPALRALTAPLANTDNAGFLRREASLAIVAMTDEPDQSPLSSTEYLDRFLNIKGYSRRTLFTFNAIGTFSNPCLGDAGKLAAYADATLGAKMNICSGDWNADLQVLGRTVFGQRSRFALDSRPDPGAPALEVQVDGAQVPSMGWSYDALANVVSFHPSYVPGNGQTVAISYAAACTQ